MNPRNPTALTPQTPGAGPVSPHADILLGLCVDGLRATGLCAAEELARISAALRQLRMTARLQRLVAEVRK